MNIHELIATRRTTFQFQDRPIPTEVLEKALEAALWGPNHKMTQPWRFILPGPELTFKLTEHLAQRLANKLRMRGLEEGEISLRVSRGAQPTIPAQILVYMVRNGDDYRQKEDYAATCCGIQNMMLAAWAEGVASGWKSFDHPEAYELFDLDPEHTQIVGLIQFGYPLKEREGLRQPLSEVLIRTA